MLTLHLLDLPLFLLPLSLLPPLGISVPKSGKSGKDSDVNPEWLYLMNAHPIRLFSPHCIFILKSFSSTKIRIRLIMSEIQTLFFYLFFFIGSVDTSFFSIYSAFTYLGLFLNDAFLMNLILNFKQHLLYRNYPEFRDQYFKRANITTLHDCFETIAN